MLINYLYIAAGVTADSRTNLDDGEHLTMIKIPFSTALEWVMNGKITHGATQSQY